MAIARRALNTNWIRAYSEAVTKISEAPGQFHIWAAIGVVGAVLKNNVFFKRGTFTIYPNNYIVLTGPPGVGKGSAIHPAYGIPKKLGLINIIPDRITAPKIIEKIANGFPGSVGTVQTPAGASIQLQKDSSAVLFSTELQTLITSSDWMLSFLCDAWDRNEFSYDTKNSGSAEIKGMCTSLIGACVPNYIRRINKEHHDINDGFTARTIFVYAEEPSKRITWPESLDSSMNGKKLIASLEADLQHISFLKGEMNFSPDGRIEVENFYKNLSYSDEDSDVVRHFKSRLLVHVIKISMIFSAAERDDLIIRGMDVSNAIVCLKHIELNLDKAFRSVGDSDLAEATSRVQVILEKKGIISKPELLGMVFKHVTSENLDRIMNMLCGIGYVKVSGQNNGIIYYILNKNINRNVVNTTVQNLKTTTSAGANGVKTPIQTKGSTN